MERLHRNLSGAILVLSLVGYPFIAPISILTGVENRLISIPFRGIILAFAIIVIVRVVLTERKLSKDWFWIIWWAFWFLYLSRIGIDTLFNPAALRLSSFEYFSHALGMCALPAIAVRYQWNEQNLAILARWIMLVGLIAIAANLYLITRVSEIGHVFALAAARRGTETLDPIGLSHLGVTVAIVASFCITSSKSSRLAVTYMLYSVLTIGIATAFIGASRGALLALATVLPLTLVAGTRKISGRKLLRLVMFAIALLAVVLFVIAQGDSIAALARIESAITGRSESVSIRIEFLKAAVAAIGENPFLGAGTEPLGYYPHNVILESFLVFGIWSGLLYCALIAAASHRAFVIFRFSNLGAWVPLLLFQYLIGAMLSGAIYTTYSLWCLLALVATLYDPVRKSTRESADIFMNGRTKQL